MSASEGDEETHGSIERLGFGTGEATSIPHSVSSIRVDLFV